MRSLVSSAVLATAVFGQSVMSASIAHPHARFHTKRAEVEKRSTNTHAFMDPADVTLLQQAQTLLGQNVDGTEQPLAPIAIGGKGPFEVEFVNQTPDQLVLVLWSGAIPWVSQGVTETAPNITQTIQKGTNTSITFNPDAASGNSPNGEGISGAFAAFTQQHQIGSIGAVDNTWGEFTFTTNGQWGAQSTMDVSRLVNPYQGSNLQIETYGSKAQSSGEPNCTSTMTSCAYQCPANPPKIPCDKGTISGCSGPYQNQGGSYDGGCTGMGLQSGYALVTFS